MKKRLPTSIRSLKSHQAELTVFQRPQSLFLRLDHTQPAPLPLPHETHATLGPSPSLRLRAEETHARARLLLLQRHLSDLLCEPSLEPPEPSLSLSISPSLLHKPVPPFSSSCSSRPAPPFFLLPVAAYTGSLLSREQRPIVPPSCRVPSSSAAIDADTSFFLQQLGISLPSIFFLKAQRDTQKPIQDIAKDLVGSSIILKVIEVNEEEKRLIFSEKDANWSKYSSQVKIGDVFDARVGSVEDYGAFVHLQFPDGLYHLTGLVHVSEVSWDLVQDVRDFLSEGEQVKVKVTQINREKSRLTLSIKQLEEDPLLETLDKVIPQEDQSVSGSLQMDNSINIEPVPGLEGICEELLQEDGITELRLGRQGLEKRVVSQDLELWLSNVPAKDKHFTLLARAGRQVQEVYLTTTLDQEGIKKAVQRVLGRVP